MTQKVDSNSFIPKQNLSLLELGREKFNLCPDYKACVAADN